MVHRKLESIIIQMLKSFRIVAINGPRQSGKTTLQRKISDLNFGVLKKPKVHFIDSGLASHLLNVDVKASMEGNNEFLGNLVETFVYSELIKHQSYADTDVDIYHFRDIHQQEVDFVALAKTTNSKNFKGIVLYGGEEVFPYTVDEYKFWVIPLKILI